MSKKKEIELDPGAEKWVSDQEKQFDAETWARAAIAEGEDEAQARAKAEAEAEEEAEMMARFSDGPEDDEHDN
jgi:hypothetical protein